MEKDTGRLEAFSDGVFAIAITLLILEIHVPKPDAAHGLSLDNGGLAKALAFLWPSFASYVVSFFVILLMWMNHHELMRLVRRVDNPLMLANGLLLFLVTFVPFPTAVLAQYLGSAATNAAAAFYCGTFFVIGIAHNLLLASVAHNHRLLHDGLEPSGILRIRKSYQLGLLGYGISTLLCLWNGYAGLLLSTSLVGVWLSLSYKVPQRSNLT